MFLSGVHFFGLVRSPLPRVRVRGLFSPIRHLAGQWPNRLMMRLASPAIDRPLVWRQRHSNDRVIVGATALHGRMRLVQGRNGPWCAGQGQRRYSPIGMPGRHLMFLSGVHFFGLVRSPLPRVRVRGLFSPIRHLAGQWPNRLMMRLASPAIDRPLVWRQRHSNDRVIVGATALHGRMRKSVAGWRSVGPPALRKFRSRPIAVMLMKVVALLWWASVLEDLRDEVDQWLTWLDRRFDRQIFNARLRRLQA
ncbi:hypothetical protein D8I24_4009 (plasmid) [Cupriavidus necator H850]|nr:hypothetical protein D8I24_4009 [Cupriavidus necator H850]